MINPVITGARTFVYINNNLIGRALAFAFNSNTVRRRVHTIDTVMAAELIQGPASVTGTITIVALDDCKGIEGMGLVAPFENLTLEKYFSIVIVDRGTDSTIFEANRCSVTSQSWNVAAKGLMTGTVTFEALEWNNEFPIQP